MNKERLPYRSKAINKGVPLPDHKAMGMDSQKPHVHLKADTVQQTNRKSLLSFSWSIQGLLWSGFNHVNQLLSD